ncbi:WD repeat-containing protein 27-like [Rhopilema esculentum]|uniref:WD repeat-containing protein 27-like n=1 Tax=Rhopilema esculentum TaxID=499914 RepID=UPI0031D63D13
MATVEHNGVIKISPQVSTAYLQISCNNEFVALPATSDEIGIWKVKECDKRPVHLRSHMTQVSALCFGHLKNPTYLCTASDDAIYLWQTEKVFIDYKTGQFTEGVKVAKELGHCNHLCFNYDDSCISACIEKEVWIINVQTLELVAKLANHTGNVTGSIFCPHDLNTFVTISEDRTFNIWNAKKAALLYQSPIICASPFWSVAMHPEYKHLAIGSGDGKVRVFDLVSHRCFHEVDISSAVAKHEFARQNSSCSSNSDQSDSSSGSSKKKPVAHGNKYHDDDDNDSEAEEEETEHSLAVLSLAYWKENICPNGTDADNDDPSSNYDGVVREVLKDPPFLIAGCTSRLVLFDANTMDIVFHLNLMEPMICQNAFDPVEYSVSSAGCFAFAISKDTCSIHCLAGSMFESNVHVLTIQPERTLHMQSDTSETSENSEAWSDSQESNKETKSSPPPELTVLSSAPVAKGSPLLSVFESKKPATKGKNTANDKDKMNQPLTFQKKVKSSGYTEKPRSAMFKPKTNGSKTKDLFAKKAADVMKISSMFPTKASYQYPTKSDPPIQLKQKFKLPTSATKINSLQFSVDGRQIACALGNKNSFLFKMPYNEKVSTLVGHDNVVNSAMFSHDKAFVVTSSDDKTAKIWTQNSQSPLLNFSNIKHNFQSEKVGSTSDKENPPFPKEITKASFYYVDKFILLSCLNTLYMYKYNIEETKQEIKRYQTMNRYKLVRKFEIKGAQHITTFSGINGFYSYIVLAACSDKSVAVFDMNTGTVARRMKNAHTRNVHTICQNQGSPYVTHPSEAYDLFLTSAATDGIKLWDLRADRCVRKFDGHVNRSQTVGVAYSPCSRFIATGSEDRSAYVFDIRNSSYLHRLSGQSDVVSCVDFHPHIPMLVTGSLDGEVRCYQDM